MPDTRGIQRHRLDVFALTTGLLALSVACLALAARADAFEVDGLVVLATVWVVLGLVGVARVLVSVLQPGPKDAPEGTG